MTTHVVLALLVVLGWGCGDGGVRHLPDAPIPDDAPIDEPPPIDADTSACTTADLSFTSARGLVTAGDGTLYYTRGSNVGRVPPCQAPEDTWVAVGVTGLTSVMVDPPNDAVYVAAVNANTIYRIDLLSPTPTAVPYATVEGPEGLTLGPDGALWSTTSNGVVRIATANSATSVTTAPMTNPKGLAFRADGSLLVIEYGGLIHALQVANGVETSRSVFADGDGGAAGFGGIIGIALDADQHVFLTQGDGGPAVVVLDPAGTVIETSEDGLASQLDFGGGPLTPTDLYVATSGAIRISRKVAGAAVPWHAP
jgi:sugar lactone lactonase YvrE